MLDKTWRIGRRMAALGSILAMAAGACGLTSRVGAIAMRDRHENSRLRGIILVLAIVLTSIGTARAFQAEHKPSRFDRLAIGDPSASLDVAEQRPDELPVGDATRAGWEAFRAEFGPRWTIVLDRRSGAPLLVEGQGIPWIAGSGNSLPRGAAPTAESLASGLREFIARHRAVLLADDGELVFNRQASVKLTPETWQVVFDRQIDGVPVAGERYLFVIGHGNLIQFGAPRWSRLSASVQPVIDEAEGLRRLLSYMSVPREAAREILRNGDLVYLPERTAGAAGPYRGPVGAGYDATLVRVYALRIAGEPGTWIGYVDARKGSVVGFFDDNRYAQVKGGVFPISNDGNCSDGCEQASYPMPYADISGGSPQTANAMGKFSCTPGGSTATTTLAGPYVKVADTCGPVSQSVTCSADIDLGGGAGTDCAVPLGASAGDTHSARTSFYHLNRIVEHARSWLPDDTWLTQQLTDNVNLDQTCNAYWDGASVNFFKSGGGCSNTGELAGVFLHEWGHGLDANDGGGYDNPTEAYADVTSLLQTHVSCIGRGFQRGNCDGYGNPCLNCTGVRDVDWNQRASHSPSKPSGFVTVDCPTDGSGYNGPCGHEQHCEGYVAGETMWDLAVRDLPASGLDAATSWQLADRLWYVSRPGSGGNAYTCSLPSSDGCAVNSWFSKLRAADDDDGDVNGTPHAAAIFAAFNRHGIACGTSADVSNNNATSCPAIGGTTLTATAGSSSASLSWTPVASAASYAILRNDVGCSSGSTIVATVTAPTTTFTDAGLRDGFAEYYRVQPIGANSACQGPVTGCASVTPQAFAGSIKLDASLYSCSSVVNVTVTDGNVGSSTTTVKLTSAVEPAGETITLTESPAGSGTYVGTITLANQVPAPDGILSVDPGDTIVASYTDANDGSGGFNVLRQTNASVDDCGFPTIRCNGSEGNWSDPSMWYPNPPGPNDAVSLDQGCIVILDQNVTIRSLSIGEGLGGNLTFDTSLPHTLNVTGSVTVTPSGAIVGPSTGTVTGHVLAIGGNLVVNGGLNLSTSGNAAGVELRFTGSGNATFSGTGDFASANLRTLSLAKSAIGNTVEVTMPFTVQGAAGSDPIGFLSASPYIGTLKISGTSTYASPIFTTPAYTIPATGGLWLNDPSFTVTAQPGSPTLSGLLHLSSGTYNVGTLLDDSMFLTTGANTIVEGGALNVAGAFAAGAATNSVSYTQSGGTVTVSTLGHTSPFGSFDLGTSPLSSLRMSGGSIVVRIPNSNPAGARDYRAAVGTALGTNVLTGGTLQFGDAGSGTAKTFGMAGVAPLNFTYFPNLVVSNASAGHTVQLFVGSVSGLSATINPTTTLNLNGFYLAVNGNATNNGTINGTAPSSRLWFYYGNGTQTLSGSGTFTAPLYELRIENPFGVTLAQSSPISTARVSLVRGTLANSNTLTLGNGGSTTGTTQFGDTSSPYPGGNYDVAPAFNAGTGGVRVEYQQESGPRTSGLEIPGSRTLAGVTVNNSNGVTLSGGPITINSFLTLTSGLLHTSSGNLSTLTSAITSPPAGSATSYVDGPLALQVNTATNTSRTFGIGSPWGWRPVVLKNFHSNGTPQTYTAQVVEGGTGGTPSAPLVYLDPVRYVRIQNTANVFSTTTANVQLSYNAAQPIGSTGTARVAESSTPAGTYASRGATTSSSPTTGIASTTAINPGDDYFVIANQAAPPAPPANDTCAGAVALSLNTPVSGTTVNALDDYELSGAACFTSQGQLSNTVSSASGRDVVYAFTAPASGLYSFRITKSASSDAVLYTTPSCPASTFPTPLVVSSCTSAANRRTSGAEEVACQSMTAGTTLYAIVDENPSSGSSFDIEVTTCDAPGPNFTPALASPQVCGNEGSVAFGGDWHFFSLGSPGSGSRVFAMLDAIASSSDDTTLRLTSATDTYEFDDNDGDVAFGAGGNASVLAGATAPPGPAYLKVYANSAVDPYRLYAAVQPSLASATSETEPNNTPGTANAATGNYFKGTITSTSDVDYYSFTAAAGDLVYLGLDGDANRDGTAMDGTLSLIASDGSTALVTVNGSASFENPAPNPGTGLDAMTPQFAGEGLVYRIRTGGTYYAKVTGTPGAGIPGQDYSLSISINCTGALADLTVPQSADSGTVGVGAPVTYTVTATNNGPGGAGSVSVTDTIPANMHFLSAAAPAGWSCGGPSGGQVVCSTQALYPSSPANVSFQYQANYCTGNVQTTHTTTVSSVTADGVPANNTSSVQTNITDTLNCDDGNVCTVDSCNALTGCVHAPGNAGTICRPASGLACDTAETCDGASAACPADTGGPNAPVGNTVRVANAAGTSTISWAGEPNPPFSVYRGLKPGGSPWSYNHSCFASGVTGTSTTDTDTPGAGGLYYYLVSRKAPPCTESSLGKASDGSERPNGSPCP